MRARFLAVIRMAGPDAGAAAQPDNPAASAEPLPVLVRGDRLTVSSNFGIAVFTCPNKLVSAAVSIYFPSGSLNWL